MAQQAERQPRPAPEQPTEQSHEYIDPNILDLAEAVLELSAKVEQLEGVAKQ